MGRKSDGRGRGARNSSFKLSFFAVAAFGILLLIVVQWRRHAEHFFDTDVGAPPLFDGEDDDSLAASIAAAAVEASAVSPGASSGSSAAASKSAPQGSSRAALRSAASAPAHNAGAAAASDSPSIVANGIGASTVCSGGLDVSELSPGLQATSCRGRPTNGAARLFVAITSPVGNFNLRAALRKGHWLMSTFPEQEASYMFFVGTSPDAKVQGKVEQEIQKFGDIVQIGLKDTYHNLAVKSVAAAAWAALRLDAAKVRYWLKVEDFMSNDFHDIDRAVADRLRIEKGKDPQPLYYAGGMIFGQNPVIPDGRWGCPKRHCPYKTYPATYAGGQYLLSMSAARLVADKGLPGLVLKDPYPIEDHYVANTLLVEAGVEVVNEPRVMWGAGKPYGAPSVTRGDFLLCIDTEDRPEVADDEEGVWEGGSLIVPPDSSIERAWYGDPGQKWTSNRGKDVTDLVRNSLNKDRHAKADGRVFGDPAPGVRKVLLVKFAPAKPTA